MCCFFVLFFVVLFVCFWSGQEPWSLISSLNTYNPKLLHQSSKSVYSWNAKYLPQKLTQQDVKTRRQDWLVDTVHLLCISTRHTVTIRYIQWHIYMSPSSTRNTYNSTHHCKPITCIKYNLMFYLFCLCLCLFVSSIHTCLVELEIHCISQEGKALHLCVLEITERRRKCLGVMYSLFQ